MLVRSLLALQDLGTICLQWWLTFPCPSIFIHKANPTHLLLFISTLVTTDLCGFTDLCAVWYPSAEEMAQQLKALAACSYRGLGLVPTPILGGSQRL